MTVPRRRSIESTRERMATEAGTDSATRARPETGAVFEKSNDRPMTYPSRGAARQLPIGPRPRQQNSREASGGRDMQRETAMTPLIPENVSNEAFIRERHQDDGKSVRGQVDGENGRR